MLKLLIADSSDILTDALSSVFKHEFDLLVCHDGEAALELLNDFAPDALILNLHLPYMDGLTLLQESTHSPRIILAIASVLAPPIEKRAERLGVQYLLRSPTVDCVRVRLMDMIAASSPPEDLAAQVAVHLHMLNFRPQHEGYRQLCIAIPLYAKQPGMYITKELYPVIAKVQRLDKTHKIERTMRTSIEWAWKHRRSAVWEKYFPGALAPPTNKDFISRIAEMLEL